VIGLTIIHDMFFFHERTRKINFWAFSFLIGPYLGPFIAGFLIQKINWRQDFGVLAAFHGFAIILIVLFGDETLYDREHPENNVESKGIMGKIQLLTGVTGLRIKGRPTIATVFKDLIAISFLPYLILPCK
jgi:MFS family permease